MNDTPDLLGHVWLDGRCKRCEMYLREAPSDVVCHPRDWARDRTKQKEKPAKKVKPREPRE